MLDNLELFTKWWVEELQQREIQLGVILDKIKTIRREIKDPAFVDSDIDGELYVVPNPG